MPILQAPGTCPRPFGVGTCKSPALMLPSAAGRQCGHAVLSFPGVEGSVFPRLLARPGHRGSRSLMGDKGTQLLLEPCELAGSFPSVQPTTNVAGRSLRLEDPSLASGAFPEPSGSSSGASPSRHLRTLVAGQPVTSTKCLLSL